MVTVLGTARVTTLPTTKPWAAVVVTVIEFWVYDDVAASAALTETFDVTADDRVHEKVVAVIVASELATVHVLAFSWS